MLIVMLGREDSWHVQQLRVAAQALRHEVKIVAPDRLVAELGVGRSSLISSDQSLMSADRILVRSLPAGSLEQVVFRMDALHRLMSAGVRVVNSPRAIETCIDKYLATARMQSAGLPVPRTVVCEQLEDALHGFDLLGGDVVFKPLFGSEGKGIVRVRHRDAARDCFQELAQTGSIFYLQEFVPHPGYDFRALVIGERVVAAMKRTSSGDFRTNASLGASVEPVELPATWQDLAIRASQSVGAEIAGVDLLPNKDGDPLLLEVNSIPGFRALASTTNVNVAREMLIYLCEGKERA